MRRFVLKKYAHMLNNEHKSILGFCSFIIIYIRCFFSHVFLPVIELGKLVVKCETCKFNKLFLIVNSKRNSFVINKFLKQINTSLKKQYIVIGFVT